MQCTCGNPKDHVIAERRSYDDKIVRLWSTGELTWALGFVIKGSPNPRTFQGRQEALRAGWLVLSEVCLYEQHEVSDLIAAARWAVRRDGLPGTMRARLAAMKERERRPNWLKPTWTTLRAVNKKVNDTKTFRKE